MNVITSTQVSRNYWWILAIRGLLAVLFGLAAFVWPGLTLLVLVLLFGAYALVDGVIAVVVSLQERRVFARWWVLLLEGLVGIAAGVARHYRSGAALRDCRVGHRDRNPRDRHRLLGPAASGDRVDVGAGRHPL